MGRIGLVKKILFIQVSVVSYPTYGGSRFSYCLVVFQLSEKFLYYMILLVVLLVMSNGLRFVLMLLLVLFL